MVRVRVGRAGAVVARAVVVALQVSYEYVIKYVGCKLSYLGVRARASNGVAAARVGRARLGAGRR